MTQDVTGAVARYARRFHATVGDGHHVASPLGAWLLLALCASANDGATSDGSASNAATSDGGTSDALTDVLGMDAKAAAETAAILLDQPHPLAPSAAATWHRPGADTDRLRHWYSSLPAQARTGPLPEQALLDAWVREHSLGLIEEFPLNVTPDVVLVLAGVLATRVSWEDPFDVAPGSALGPQSPWAGRLSHVLSSPSAGHVTFIATTETVGDVIVHAADAGSGTAGLSVVSVAAAPEVPYGDVLAVAHEIAPAVRHWASARRVSLFDLPVGETALWSIREDREPTRALDGREERHRALLPCWAADGNHDLSDPSLGFPLAARVLAPLLGHPDLAFEARQSAVARYGRYGFEAAAATGFAAAESEPADGVVRTADLRFGHPYAVVAIATDIEFRAGAGPVRGPWHGLPVFSGWVSRPDDVPDDEAAPAPDA
ncbi:hypothetical protein ACTI_85020 [Actinoplanes sp. OR16]|uniref:hypothetical protein n=1 Tax=Actinoplanes sp. OR16 TaxID=946334 RepID=UPI000F70EBE8|nr:hypothetical protein [Actinoplanes sp. OR16]BBH71817.1 hypothetical protein ACTI_85020 [Actinoplanes sp. OR16]